MIWSNTSDGESARDEMSVQRKTSFNESATACSMRVTFAIDRSLCKTTRYRTKVVGKTKLLADRPRKGALKYFGTSNNSKYFCSCVINLPLDYISLEQLTKIHGL